MSWGLADQVLSSMTNFILGIIVARSVSAEGFGRFSLAFAFYLFAVGIGRATVGEPLTVRFSAAPREEHRVAVRAATGTAVLFGTVGLGLALSASMFLNDDLGKTFVALGCSLPGLLLQDAWRYAFFSSERGRHAFVNDLVWTIVLLALVGFTLASDRGSVAIFVLIWGGSALVAAVVGMAQARLLPDLSGARSWFRDHHDLFSRFNGEFLARNAGNTGPIYIAAWIAGLVAAGALRAGQVLLGPLNVLNMGLTIVALPEARKLLTSNATKLNRFLVIVSVGIGLPAIAWGLLLLAIPDAWGSALLKASWPGARAVVFPLALGLAAHGFQTGPQVGLRVLEAAHTSLRIRVITAVLLVGGSIAGAHLGGSVGVAWVTAAILWATTIYWWSEHHKALHPYLANERAEVAS